MKKKFLTVSTASLAAAVALAGCAAAPGAGTGSTPGSTHSSAGMDHGTPAASEFTAPASGAPEAATEHNAADTKFAQSMIPHHTQAVEMSGILLAKKDVPAAVKSLAERIKAAQAPEIEIMTGWLQSWNETVPSTGTGMGGHDMGGSGGSGMTGMMSEDDLNKLKAAQGTEAARLFLTQMIAHHEGAVTMAKAESAGGSNPGAIKLSQGIAASQQTEIQEMRKLLAAL